MRKQSGFTLIELLIVIAIIAILAAAVFVALDPVSRFRNARNATRWSDAENILNAIKIAQVDAGGTYPGDLATVPASATNIYMLGTGATAVACVTGFPTCTTTTGAVAITAANPPSLGCLDLTTELATYLATMPVDPTGGTTYTATRSGYFLKKDTTGAITVGACTPETQTGVTHISVTR